MRNSIRSVLVFCLVNLAISAMIEAASVDLDTAFRVAEETARLRGSSATPIRSVTDEVEGVALFYVVEFEPKGFVIVAGHSDLSPVIAYSFLDSFPREPPERDILLELLRRDLSQRLERLSSLPAVSVEKHHRRVVDQLSLINSPGRPRPSISPSAFDKAPDIGHEEFERRLVNVHHVTRLVVCELDPIRWDGVPPEGDLGVEKGRGEIVDARGHEDLQLRVSPHGVREPAGHRSDGSPCHS